MHITNLWEYGGIQTCEMELSLEHGESVWVSIESAIEEDAVAEGIGRGILIRSVLIDITERKSFENRRLKWEQDFAQIQRMETLGYIASGISHDFNNILHVIMGNAQLALDKAIKDGDIYLQGYIGNIVKGCDSAAQNIDNLLLYSHSGSTGPAAVSFSIEVIKLLKLLEGSLPSSIDVKLDIAEELPNVLVDPDQLNQVLINLCITARDAMQGEGIIEIGASLVEMAGAGNVLLSTDRYKNPSRIEKCFCADRHHGCLY